MPPRGVGVRIERGLAGLGDDGTGYGGEVRTPSRLPRVGDRGDGVVQYLGRTGGGAEQAEDASGEGAVHVAGQFGHLVQRRAEQCPAVSHLVRAHDQPAAGAE